MFARQGIRAASRFGVRSGVRFASSSSLGSKVTGFVDGSVYWTKVTGQVLKQVYEKEGLAPPKGAEFKKLYQDSVKQTLMFVKDPKRYSTSLLRSAQGFTSSDVVKYSCYFVQLLGCFALGEMVGRGKVVGYPSYGPKTN